MYDLAAKLVSKARFPEAANNNEWARYQYYLGKQWISCGRRKTLDWFIFRTHQRDEAGIFSGPEAFATGVAKSASTFGCWLQASGKWMLFWEESGSRDQRPALDPGVWFPIPCRARTAGNGPRII